MKTAVRPQTGLILLLVLVLVIGIALGLLIARPLFRHDEESAEPIPEPVEEHDISLAEEQFPELPQIDESPIQLEQDAEQSFERFKQLIQAHWGLVYIYDGFDWIFMKPLEGVPVNSFSKDEFQMENGRPVYLGNTYEIQLGVDVSEHQYDIDWRQVADSGVDFVYIRIGRRGYTEGGLFEDPWFEKNYREAAEAGLQLGVYFYSQAISEEEALEEASFVLDMLQGRALDLPIVFDWEKIDNEDAAIARTNGLGKTVRTDCAVAFCEAIRAAGYDACVYFNRNIGYYGYDLTRLTDYSFWFALPIAPPELCWPSFYYRVDLWQYSFTEKVPGIEGETDMNMLFIPIPQPETESSSMP